MTVELVHIVRDTLEQIEQSADCRPGDPAMQKLRQEVTGAIIRLEIVKEPTGSQESSPSAPIKPQSEAA